MVASQKGYSETVKFLLQMEAEVNIQNKVLILLVFNNFDTAWEDYGARCGFTFLCSYLFVSHLPCI